jgi:hypothetical protein
VGQMARSDDDQSAKMSVTLTPHTVAVTTSRLMMCPWLAHAGAEVVGVVQLVSNTLYHVTRYVAKNVLVESHLCGAGPTALAGNGESVVRDLKPQPYAVRLFPVPPLHPPGFTGTIARPPAGKGDDERMTVTPHRSGMNAVLPWCVYEPYVCGISTTVAKLWSRLPRCCDRHRVRRLTRRTVLAAGLSVLYYGYCREYCLWGYWSRTGRCGTWTLGQ